MKSTSPIDFPATSPVVLREVRSREEREAVFAFRYRIYVEEMGRRPKGSDDARRRLTDELDREGIVLAAFQDGAVVGTARLNVEGAVGLGGYDRLYEIEQVRALPGQRAIGTALMVDPAFRGTGLALRLIRAALARAVDEGVRFVFIDASPHLTGFYQRMGGRLHRAGVEHPDYGSVDVILLDLADLHRLEAMRSPLRSMARKYAARTHRVAA